MSETPPELQKALEEIRREAIESRNMTIKTDNALKTLHAELKVVAGNQSDFEKRTWFSTGVAYLLFVALSVGGVVAITNARTAAAQAEKERLEKQVQELNAQTDKAKAETAALIAAEQSAAQVYKLMTTLPGEERLKGIDALAKLDQTKLSAFSKQVLADRALALRKEIGSGILEKGKNAFRRNDWPETIELLTRFMAMNPVEDDALDASYFLGNALLQVRKFDESVKYLTRFVEGDKRAKNRDFAMLLLVQAYDAVGNKEKALEIAREAMNQYPAGEFRAGFYMRIQRAQGPAAAPATAPAVPAAPAAAPTPAAH
jgi:TolA-binding protein